MTDFEKNLVNTLKTKDIINVTYSENSIKFIVKGEFEELNEEIEKTNPSQEFIDWVADKVRFFYFAKRETELAEHYVDKWLDEQKMPKTKKDLLDFAKYTVGCMLSIYEQDKK